MKIAIDQIVTVRGRRVLIVDFDNDPRCEVHGVLANDPDRSVWFLRNEIEG